jgi:GntR family transcriptional repressor for pyruvate dehydrogenase complex
MASENVAGPPSGLFSTLEREASLVERVTAQLEGLIFDGRLLVGESMPPERELARIFGVSRTVVREATARLAAQGLLELRPGGGMAITSPSPAAVGRSMTLMMRGESLQVDYSKVLEVRRLLEVEIAGLAAQRRTPADLNRFAALLAEAAESQQDGERFPALDVDFHMALAQATKNVLFVALMETMSDILVGFRQIGYQVPGMPARSLYHHRAIYEQVAAGSAEGARNAMRCHLDESEQTVREAQMAAASQANAMAVQPSVPPRPAPEK